MSHHSIDVNAYNFQQLVIEASKTAPVLVDFWAPWCAPCRALTPVPEKLADEYQGRFTLAKLDSDENPAIAAQFGVRGIPNIKAVVDGRLVDEFSGALPEAAVRAFIERVVPSPAEELRLAAQQAYRERRDADRALEILTQAAGLDPRNEDVAMDRAEVLSLNEQLDTPAGKFTNCLRTEETSALEAGREDNAEFDAKKPDRSQVSLYLMNNMFFTNIPLSQPGPATFRWSVRSHDGDWVAGKAHAFAWETSHPLETFVIGKKHQCTLPPNEHSFLSVDADNVVCSTLKPAEANGEGFILRFFELTGKASRVRVHLPMFDRIARATETNLIEDDREIALPVSNGNEITLSIRPFGVKTVRVVPEQSAALTPPTAVRARATSDREITRRRRGRRPALKRGWTSRPSISRRNPRSRR